MKIGFVTTSYPRDAGDFAGSFVATRVDAQIRRGREISVVAAGSGARSPNVLRIASPLFSGEGAPERLALMGCFPASLFSLAFTMQQAAAVRTRLRDCDAIESHWLVPSALAVSLAFTDIPREQRPTHHAVAHSGDVYLLEHVPLGGALLRTVLAEVDTLQVVSESLARRIAILCGDGFSLPALTVAPMESSSTFFRARPVQSGSDFILGVGRLVPIKGFEDLLFAVGRLPRWQRPRVVLLGDGPLRDRLARLARALCVDLDLRGLVSPAEVSLHLAGAAALAVPSRTLPDGRREGAPVVIREALAVGVPIIASESAAEGLQPGPSIRVFKDGDRIGLCSALSGWTSLSRARPVAPASRLAHPGAAI